MDLDGRFLRSLNYANLDVRENVVDADFSSGTFDLVHTRWTLMHTPEREHVLQTFADCLAPGGTLIPGRTPIRFPCGRSTALDSKRCRCACSRSSSHVDRIRTGAVTCRSKWRRSGSPTRAEGETPYFQGASELAEFWRISWGRVRDAVAESGADVTQWDRELAELDDPTRLFVSPMTVAVIATKISSPRHLPNRSIFQSSNLPILQSSTAYRQRQTLLQPALSKRRR
jgi:Methyltransferase domain